MSSMLHGMIDLETLGTTTGSIILTLGAVKFSPFSGEVSSVFYRRIDTQSCKDIGLTQEKQTLDWWQKQPVSVRYEAMENPRNRMSICSALNELIDWFGNDVEIFWSQGIDFDFPILETALRKCSLPIPWKFYNKRDSRTVCDIARVKVVRGEDSHNALADCIAQVKALKKAYEVLGIKK